MGRMRRFMSKVRPVAVQGLEKLLGALDMAQGKGNATPKTMRQHVADSILVVLAKVGWTPREEAMTWTSPEDIELSPMVWINQIFAQHTGDGYDMMVSFKGFDSSMYVVRLGEFLRDFVPCGELSTDDFH